MTRHIATLAPLAATLLAAPAIAQTAPANPGAIAAAVSEAELKANITALVGFGTRHSASDTKSPTRGIGAARRWAESRFRAFSAACGNCLTIETPAQTFSGPRLPTPTEIVDVIAIQRGTTDPDRYIIMSAHIDSRNSEANDAKGDAPGANDDGSGTAAVIEAARVLSKYKFPATIVYAALSGEEQGLNGGKVLADYARAKGWNVEAVLNNDIIGNSTGIGGMKDSGHVRVFSEGTKAVESAEQANRRRYNGGEVDSPSRNLARFLDTLADHNINGLDVKMIYRTDRFGRGGDQTRFLEAGYPAVRITESVEHYDRQHQNVRVENGRSYGDLIDGVDFQYLGKVTKLNVAALVALARAPMPPAVTIQRDNGSDTKVSWTKVPGAAGYKVWWRDTTAPQWQYSRTAPADATSLVLEHAVIDDWLFGVSTIAADGSESPIAFPGDAGNFVSNPPFPAAQPRP
ncbi:M20/M25/M40 family metallo-hydrolase [Sandarakinorhabdus rubra]|uniref:M20/M25/M40 family metallo-hydrolase n=1 Tax=Sandarakinorhabdus rubra TaxID=2672568 RepID=UPI0013DC0313|nr:M20/M25/M40 family metallo-hydrolase [Sandarakinorhabdus rubra]